MARVREFEPTEVIEKSVALFHERGYNDTSMEDLVKYTGVSRYGIYGEFGNKRALFIRALEHFHNKFSQELVLDMAQPDAGLTELRDFFKRLMVHAYEEEGRLGCFMCNTAMELASQDKIIGEMIRDKNESVRELMRNALENAVNRGEITLKSDPDSYATYLQGIKLGMATMLKSEYSEERMQQFANVALADIFNS